MEYAIHFYVHDSKVQDFDGKHILFKILTFNFVTFMILNVHDFGIQYLDD